MTIPFAIIALLTITATVAAVSLRNLVHCALAAAIAFGGIAATYLQLDAQFVGFAQVLVYVGAVAILIVFAVLLTRGGEPGEEAIFSKVWVTGVAIAAAVFGVLAWTIKSSLVSQRELTAPPDTSVKQIGDVMMHKYILPLEVIGLLLTAALIGAVIIAMKEDNSKVEHLTNPLVTGGHS